MKAVKLAIKLIAVISFTAFFACNSNPSGENDTQNTDSVEVTKQNTNKNTNSEPKETTEKTTPKDYTAKYICPMHCPKSGGDKLGDCPECGMELIENPTTKKVISKKK